MRGIFCLRLQSVSFPPGWAPALTAALWPTMMLHWAWIQSLIGDFWISTKVMPYIDQSVQPKLGRITNFPCPLILVSYTDVSFSGPAARFVTSVSESYAGRSTTTHQLVSRSKPQQWREALAVLQWLFHCRLVTMHFFHAIKQMLYYSSTMQVPSKAVYHVKGTPGSSCLPLCGAFWLATL